MKFLKKNFLVIAILAVAIFLLGQGLYIHAKAFVAQQLLEVAWQRTRASQTHAKPWAWADTYPVARLQVEKYQIDQIVLAGATGRSLAFAPGYMLASGNFGERKDMVISGHRDTHFRFLQQVQVGDRVVLEDSQGKQHHYIVERLQVVDTRATPLQLSQHEAGLKLITCYPFNVIAPTGPLRYVVDARRLDS